MLLSFFNYISFCYFSYFSYFSYFTYFTYFTSRLYQYLVVTFFTVRNFSLEAIVRAQE